MNAIRVCKADLLKAVKENRELHKKMAEKMAKKVYVVWKVGDEVRISSFSSRDLAAAKTADIIIDQDRFDSHVCLIAIIEGDVLEVEWIEVVTLVDSEGGA